MKSTFKLSSKALLIILDGYGINEKDLKNAILHAKKPTLDHLFSSYPYTTIEAGGVAVGLPEGIAGNSEVGHINLGCGKLVRQDLVRINEAIVDNSFSSMEKMQELIKVTSESSGKVHIMGLLSDGGVHSHIDHLKEISRVLKAAGLQPYFHAFMDGRDTARDSGIKYIEELEKIDGLTLASLQGRSIGMDRDRRFEKIKQCYDTLLGKGAISSLSPQEYIKNQYSQEIYDEFITPVLLNENYKINKEDSIFFINFRPDRAIQITLAFTDPKFSEFKQSFIPNYFLCMTPYVSDEVTLPILFDKESVKGTLSEFISSKGLKQFKIAETEKFAHITYFFNGGKKEAFPGETRLLVPSPREVATYDQKPEMSAGEVTDKLLSALDEDYSLFLVNFANSDMVGHTGNFQAGIRAIEMLDQCVQKLVEKCSQNNISILLTADHGNSDQMVYEGGAPHTSHTGSPVPVCLIHPSIKNTDFQINSGDFALKDISSTLLYIMGEDPPHYFSGKPIFK